MKKFLSLIMVLAIICSMSVAVFATTDYTNGTKVVYDATADNDGDGNPDSSEAWTVTVPATMTPGETAEVSVSGTWASNRKLVVNADASVTLTNSINMADQKVLKITFAGIEKVGSNIAAIAASDEGAHASLTIAEITDALFGDWSGHFDYTVEMQDVA